MWTPADHSLTEFPWAPLGVVWAGGAALQLCMWGLARRTRSANWVDLGWSLTLLGGALGVALVGDGAPAQRALAAGLGGLWAGRLSWHLLFDRTLGESEDGRYQVLRRHWGARAEARFFWFFQIQALLAAILALPFVAIAAHPERAWAPVQWAGVALFVAAEFGESVADRQLARWRRDPANRGRTCRSGLWRYSRHPNYFFEWLIWVGFALAATPTAHGIAVWSAPLLIYVFVTRLTGIPYTEAQALRSRGDDYRRYQRTTSAFFPWFPRPESGVATPAADSLDR